MDLLVVAHRRDVYVLEVNGIPGWKGLQSATGIDVAAAIVEQVETRVARTSRAHGASSVHA